MNDELLQLLKNRHIDKVEAAAPGTERMELVVGYITDAAVTCANIAFKEITQATSVDERDILRGRLRSAKWTLGCWFAAAIPEGLPIKADAFNTKLLIKQFAECRFELEVNALLLSLHEGGTA